MIKNICTEDNARIMPNGKCKKNQLVRDSPLQKRE